LREDARRSLEKTERRERDMIRGIAAEVLFEGTVGWNRHDIARFVAVPTSIRITPIEGRGDRATPGYIRRLTAFTGGRHVAKFRAPGRLEGCRSEYSICRVAARDGGRYLLRVGP